MRTVSARSWDRPIKDDDQFAYASARALNYTNNLLTKDNYEDLIYKDSDFTTWVSWWARTFNAGNYEVQDTIRETILRGAEQNNRLLRELSWDSQLADILLLGIDYHNAKVMLKSYILTVKLGEYVNQEQYRRNRDMAELLKTNSNVFMKDGNTSIDVLADFIARTLLEESGTGLDERLAKHLSRAVAKIKDIDINAKADLLASVDRVLNQEYFLHFLELCDDKENASYRELLLDYISIKADSSNLQSFVRTKLYDLDPVHFQREFVSGGAISFEDYADYLLYDKEDLKKHDILKDHKSLIGDLIDLLNKDLDEFLRKFSITRDKLYLRLANRGKSLIYGADLIFSLWMRNRIEEINLRTILALHEQGVDRDEIAAHLRV